MNKTAIKNYATRARTELIAAVSQRAYEYEVTDGGTNDPRAEIIGGRPLSGDEQRQRRGLIEQIGRKGFAQTMEEAAYTWFNRFIALRYMEVNGYLPTGVRVFTNEAGEFRPEMLKEAMTVDLPGLDREQILELLDKQDNETLFKLLLIAQCNALSDSLPVMFERISDWTELLFPANLLKADSVIGRMIDVIPESDWQDQVQILGWLYQYYNSEKKDDVFAALKKNVKITKENIPAATQLFTPDWIVRYMVENSLGRMAVSYQLLAVSDENPELSHHEKELARIEKEKEIANSFGWKYYLPEAEQDESVRAQLKANSCQLKAEKLEELRVIDPCCGSGHILAYMFDVLVQIYETSGYTTRDAVRSIVENNLYGLDIDDRAAQLAYFSVMMKACQYDRRFLKRGAQPHVHAIAESNAVESQTLEYFCAGDAALAKAMKTIVSEMHDAKEYGSILTVTPQDWEAIYNRFDEIYDDISLARDAAMAMLPMVQSAEALAQKYHAVVTNPPYMAAGNMDPNLSNYVKNNYPDTKADLFSVFAEHMLCMAKKNGKIGLMTSYTWMFISTFEKFREYIFRNASLLSLVQPEYHAFFESANVPICSFILQQGALPYCGTYVKLSEFYGADIQGPKFLEAKNSENCTYKFIANQSSFSKIPGAPIAYWVEKSFIDNFGKGVSVDTISDFTGSQNITADNNRFLRCFWEVADSDIGKNRHWAFYAKGGDYRKWYGNNSLIVDTSEEAIDFYKSNPTSNYLHEKYWFTEGISYSAITSSGTGFRYYPAIGGFDKGGATICYVKDIHYILALLNSKVAEFTFQLLNPTINLQVKDVKALPVIINKEYKSKLEQLAIENVELSKTDWDSFEASWDFETHPLVRKCGLIENIFKDWQLEAENRHRKLKKNEEEINQIFISIYGLSHELEYMVADKYVTVKKADKNREIRSLISYAVGCMFGRYSLDVPGLAYAGGEWDASKYTTFPADPDNIIPICDDEYFEDDIVGRFVKFIEVVYGADTLEENLKFIAEALGGKGQPREVIRSYFLNDFYADHCSTYSVTGSGKRPIYWLFDSGKKNGFKCLIYMHRYQPDTIARIRTDYVHEQQSRYRTAIADLEERVDHAAAGERVKLNKKLAYLKDQDLELRGYEEKIHHLADQMIAIDLDDGVKVNYAKFQDVLAKIK